MASLILPMSTRVTATSQLPGRTEKTRSSDHCGTFQWATAQLLCAQTYVRPAARCATTQCRLDLCGWGQLLILELVSDHMERTRVYNHGVHSTSILRSGRTKSLTVSAVCLLAGDLLPTGTSSMLRSICQYCSSLTYERLSRSDSCC